MSKTQQRQARKIAKAAKNETVRALRNLAVKELALAYTAPSPSQAALHLSKAQTHLYSYYK